jgi:hypothetical protein
MNDIVKAESIEMTPATPATLLAMAVQQGADLDKLEKLMELQERWEKNEARKSFVSAMNSFKANPPEILKNKHVKFGETEYDHATLHHVVDVITQSLSNYGLSHRWTTEQLDGGQIRVTCVLTHVQGHSESTSLQAGADASGKKNNIQALGSTVTYLQRYTLLAATGTAAKGTDDDGVSAETVETVSDEQAANIQCLIDDVAADKTKFLGYLAKAGKVTINRIEDIPASMYSTAIQSLEQKRKKK